MNQDYLSPTDSAISKLGPPWWVWVAGIFLLLLSIAAAATLEAPIETPPVPILSE